MVVVRVRPVVLSIPTAPVENYVWVVFARGPSLRLVTNVRPSTIITSVALVVSVNIVAMMVAGTMTPQLTTMLIVLQLPLLQLLLLLLMSTSVPVWPIVVVLPEVGEELTAPIAVKREARLSYVKISGIVVILMVTAIRELARPK